jgi:superfamily II DNA/RNA helicase
MKFEQIELNPLLKESLKNQGFSNLNQIQEMMIPLFLKGRDINLVSQTGSGKTYAILISMINGILSQGDLKNKLNCIILVPTREVARDTLEAANKLLHGTESKAVALFGGDEVAANAVTELNGESLAICTPRKLIECIDGKKLEFSSLKYFAVDELDRLLDMGYYDDLRYIFDNLPRGLQTILSGAALTPDMTDIIQDYLKEPEQVEILNDKVNFNDINFKIFHLARNEKATFLVNFLKNAEPDEKILIYVNSVSMSRILQEILTANQLVCKDIPYELTQEECGLVLGEFEENKFRIIVSNDLALQYTELPRIRRIINYDMPENTDSLSQRMAKLDKKVSDKTILSLCSEFDFEILPTLEAFIEKKMETSEIPEKFLQEIKEREGDFRTSGNYRPSYERNNDRRPAYERNDERRPAYERNNERRPAYGRNDERRPAYGRNDERRPAFERNGERRPTYRGDRRETRAREPRGRENMNNIRGRQGNRPLHRRDEEVLSSGMEEQEPMVTVYKRGSYIDPMEAKKELLNLENLSEKGKGGSMFSGVKNLLKKIFSATKKNNASHISRQSKEKDWSKEKNGQGPRNFKPRRPKRKVGGYGSNRNEVKNNADVREKQEKTESGDERQIVTGLKPTQGRRNRKGFKRKRR